MGDIRTLCDRAILLVDGRILKDGPPDEVADYYNALVAAKENAKLTVEQRRDKQGWLRTSSGTGEAKITGIYLYDANNKESVTLARVGQRLRLVADVKVTSSIPSLVLGYMLRDRAGHVIWGSNTWHTKQRLEEVKAGTAIRFDLVFTCTLGPGSYSFSPALVSTDTHLVDNYEWIDNAVVFDVINTDRDMFIGSSYLDAQFELSFAQQR
jgi:lipopolysaccharide transport system ATP-binding protein